MNRKARLVTATMVFLGMLSVLALPVIAEDGWEMDEIVTLDDDTIECYQTVWIRIDAGPFGAGMPVYCNLTDPHGTVYYLGEQELSATTGEANYSYAPECTGGVWTVNVTAQTGFDDGGEWEFVLLTFTMQSATQCIADSVNTLAPTFLYIFVVVILIVLLLIIVAKFTDREKKVK